MNNHCNLIQSLPEAEFRSHREKLGMAVKDASKFTPSDAADIEKIELLLDVRPGVLKSEQFYLEKATCKGCGRTLTMYDFVLSGLVDASHDKSFILHTLIGSKFIINKARTIRCSACGTMTTEACGYCMPNYQCDGGSEQ